MRLGQPLHRAMFLKAGESAEIDVDGWRTSGEITQLLRFLRSEVEAPLHGGKQSSMATRRIFGELGQPDEEDAFTEASVGPRGGRGPQVDPTEKGAQRNLMANCKQPP